MNNLAAYVGIMSIILMPMLYVLFKLYAKLADLHREILELKRMVDKR